MKPIFTMLAMAACLVATVPTFADMPRGERADAIVGADGGSVVLRGNAPPRHGPNAAAIASIACVPARSAKRRIDILFIGNSYTYYNNMPAMLEAIAKVNGVEANTKLIATGGENLHDHIISNDASRALNERRWDWVVLQEQSSFGDTYLVNGVFRVRPTYRWMDDVRALAHAARAMGARVALFGSWADKAAPQDQPLIDQLHDEAAARAGACVIHMSGPRSAFRRSLPGVELYVEDGSHPTPIASFLNAATILQSFSSISRLQVPVVVRGQEIRKDDGVVIGNPIKRLVQLDASQADAIRSASRPELSRAAKAGPIAPVEEPKLPTGGHKPAIESLAGVWAGRLDLYPSPATFEIRFHQVDGKLVADTRAKLAAGGEREVRDLPVQLTATGIEFSDPHGPSGTTLFFEGAFDPKAGLSGIAHFEKPQAMRGVGRWRATRLR